MRIVITGPPKAGKTYLSEILGKVLGHPVYHTDDTKTMEWSDASQEVSTWFDRPGDWIIEGVVVPRAIRKWLSRQGPEGSEVPVPFDRLVLIRKPRELLTLQGQQTMEKTVLGLSMIYRGWIGERWVEL